ncbi:VIT1/CCC1 transporter family protein [Cellvibrio fontiphilus]|uniref:VIT family protein n=1 Tax=Cellvibrio fontiphilus TaxID=1815559 RepID=A0ABV7FC01_9GAMM
MRHREIHRSHHAGWLRAAVLGANDGIISTASLMMGIAATASDSAAIVLAGVAGLVAGAMSMAAGEYVSVRSQADTEAADLARERHELATDSEAEHRELEEIYVARGLERPLAKEVAKQLMLHDALGAHARDELGITEVMSARPLQAALTSAATFAVGAALPLLALLFVPASLIVHSVAGISLLALLILGGVAAKVGGAPVLPGALRVGFWGAAAMLLTYAAGHFFGALL